MSRSAPRQKSLAAILFVILIFGATARVQAQFVLPEVRSVRSVSGQFVIRGIEPGQRSVANSSLATNREFVRLDPTVLAVSCERIKQLVLRELADTAAWRGKISLQLHAGGQPNDAVVVTSSRFTDGWNYQLDLPESVHRGRFVRGLVQALLLEIANRQAGARAGEVPVWLTEGLAQFLLASSEISIILLPPRPIGSAGSDLAGVFNSRRTDPMASAREHLRARSALTFEQLSWPEDGQLAGEAGETYRRSSQVFINELLQLPDGRAAMRAMLAELPQHENWQFAFLHAFQAHFEQPLDVEKWWALHLAHFTGREVAQTWPLRESWQKMDQALYASVEVRAKTNDLPLRTEISLQDILREWEPAAARQALQVKARELRLLHIRIAPDLSYLLTGYEEALDAYLANAEKIGSLLAVRKQARLRRTAQETIAQLDALDEQRRAAQPRSPAPAAAPGKLPTGKRKE